MSATVIDELIEALQTCDDLDQLQAVVASNEIMDAHAPTLRDWLLKLVNAERQYRDGPGEAEYPIADFSRWPNPVLVQHANMAVVITEASLIVGNPTIQHFAMRLLQLLVGLLGLSLLETERR